MNDVQRRVDVQIDAQIPAEIIRRDIKTLSEHVGEVDCEPKPKSVAISKIDASLLRSW